MVSIVIIGVVIAVAVFVLLANRYAGKPKRAEKWEKADIMRQLLALSDRESGLSAIAPPVRSRAPLADRRVTLEKSQPRQKRNSQPIRSHK
jgi:hypothetical protein